MPRTRRGSCSARRRRPAARGPGRAHRPTRGCRRAGPRARACRQCCRHCRCGRCVPWRVSVYPIARRLLRARAVSDAMFSIITGGLWLVLFAAYGLRVARIGAYRSERVAGVGGTAIMGQNMMQATYWGLDPIVRGLAALGLTANAVTTMAL